LSATTHNGHVIFFDEGGNPIMLEAAAGSRRRVLPNRASADLVTPDATSGPAEWGRYHDAVREAARSFDDPHEGDIHHFLQARARNPEQVDIGAFHEAVRRQRMADLVDIVDHHMRRDGSLPRGARMVRVQAPRGYMRRVLRNSSPEDLAHLRHRLTSIGHSQESVDSYLAHRAKPDMWDQATAYEVQMSDDEFEGLEFDDSDSGWVDDEREPITINVFVNGIKAEVEESR
jgi:hypothetical protein